MTATATPSAVSGAAQPLYRLHPKQKDAMRLLGLDHRWSKPYGWAVEEMLYGGEAGGGKSLLARAVAFTLAHIWPGARIPIFRRTYPELEDTHILKVMTEWRGTGYYHGGTHEWRFHNGSAIPFRHCEREADVYRYFSAEWEGLIIDEATQFTEFQITTLRSRVRATRPRWRPLILYTANPGGVGHAFFKENFVDAAQQGKPFMGPPLAPPNEQFRRCFLRARLDDNPSLSKADYDRVLAGISDVDLRRALREGDWNIFSGQMFRWRPEDHVCEPFAIPDSWYRRYVTVDWGFGAPWAAYFLVRDEDAWRRDNITRWYVYQEFYSPGIRDQQQARLIRDQIESDSLFRARTAPRLVWDAVADPSMWNQSSQTGLSPADIYQQAMVPIMPANNDRVNGWQRVRQYLARQPDERAALVFFDHCENAVRTIRNLSRNRTHPEDADCFVAGTLITTPTEGLIPIEQLRVGDWVETPIGPRRVIKAGVSGHSDSDPVWVYEIYDEYGVPILCGTANHRVYVHEKGLVQLCDLAHSDILGVRITTRCDQSFTRELRTRAETDGATTSPTGPTWLEELRRSTSGSTPTPMGRPRGATTFITKTTITTTTPLETLSPSPRPNTPAITWHSVEQRYEISSTDGRRLLAVSPYSETMHGRCWSGHPSSPGRAGIVAHLVERDCRGRDSTAPTDASTCGSEPTGTSASASSAMPSSGERSATRNRFKHARTVADGRFVGLAPVYNLTVEESGLYYANGILSTNTHAEDHAADAIRYFCMTQAALEVPDERPDARRYGLDSGQQPGTTPDANVASGKLFERALASAQGRVTRRRAG